MPDPTASSGLQPVSDSRLANLQRVIDVEIPICQQMGVRVEGIVDDALLMSCPLERNRNHQATAFAGSLNALCTIAGWGLTYLETESFDPSAVIVIHRSSIKYHRPVDSAQIVARCLIATDDDRRHYQEMFAEKGQAKLNLRVEIDHPPLGDGPRVSFQGAYVAMRPTLAS